MAGISGEELATFVNKNPAPESNFCGVYAIDQLAKDFLTCAIKVYDREKSKLPFALANTDPIDKPGTHWFSIIKLQDGTFFLFDSFGIVGFMQFIISNDSSIIDKFLTNFKTYQYENEDQKMQLYSFEFNLEVFLKLKKSDRGL